jgi:hypothetical protein
MSGFSRKLQQASNSTILLITPSNGSGAHGNNISVSIYEDSGYTSVNAVQANLAYSTSFFQFVSATNAGSPFATSIQNTGGNGSVQIAVASLGTSSIGRQLVATVTFTLISAGTSSISFGPNSAVDRTSDSSNVLTSTVGTTFVIS